MQCRPMLLVYGAQSHNIPKRLADQEVTRNQRLKVEKKAAGWVSKHCGLNKVIEKVPARDASVGFETQVRWQ